MSKCNTILLLDLRKYYQKMTLLWYDRYSDLSRMFTSGVPVSNISRRIQRKYSKQVAGFYLSHQGHYNNLSSILLESLSARMDIKHITIFKLTGFCVEILIIQFQQTIPLKTSHLLCKSFFVIKNIIIKSTLIPRFPESLMCTTSDESLRCPSRDTNTFTCEA